MKKSILTLLAALFVSAISFATTYRCNNNLGINQNSNTATFFRNFSEAYAASSNGDTIIVEASPNNYSYVYDAAGLHVGYFDNNIGKSLTIVGNGAWATSAQQVNTHRSRFNNLDISATDVNLYGIGINNLNIGKNNLNLQRCHLNTIGYHIGDCSNILIKENFINYNISLNGYTHTSVIIANNIIRYGQIHLNSTDIVVIENNTIGVGTAHYGTGGGGNGYVDLGSANAVFRNNIKRGDLVNYSNATVENNIALGNYALPTGSGNIINADVADVLTGSDLNNDTDLGFQLKTGGANPNPALNTGFYGNGDDIGAFSDGTNRGTYRLGGIPPFPAIYKLSTGSAVGNSMNVTISTRANN